MDYGRPGLRRAWTTDGDRAPFSSFTSGPIVDDHAFGGPPPHDERRRSFFRTAYAVFGAVHDFRRQRAQQRSPETPSQYRDTRPGLSRRDSSYDHSRRSRRSHTRDRGSPARRSQAQERSEYNAVPSAETSDADRELRELEKDMVFEEEEIDACSHWLSRYADRGDGRSSRKVEAVKRELYEHKQRLREVKQDMSRLKAEQETRREHARPRPHRRATQPSQPSTQETIPPDLDEVFNLLFSTFPTGPQRRDARPGPSMPHAQLFEHLFAGMAGAQFAFPIPDQRFGSGFDSDGGPRFMPQPAYSRPTPSAARPVRLLSTIETKQIYDEYNARWTALSPTDADVPYPGRKLKSASLLASDSIHAPFVTSPVTTWSVEDRVRANTQHFFLALVSFSPSFHDRAGKIEMTFDHGSDGAAQLQALAEYLKREKLRWHSDRLGRRDGGQGMVNTALQQDEVTRAVFHAVCELSELVQSKR